jgi:hypothetical protein
MFICETVNKTFSFLNHPNKTDIKYLRNVKVSLITTAEEPLQLDRYENVLRMPTGNY